MKVKKEIKNSTSFAQNIIKVGLIFVGTSLLLGILIFFPVLKEEIKYSFMSDDVKSGDKVTPEEVHEALKQGKGIYYNGEYIITNDKKFGIVVPKIGANSSVVENVDPFNPKEYQKKLTQGVAHAKGTALPNQIGNVFLFAHSSDNFYNANRYNAVFYLLKKLDKGDNFYLIKDGATYSYEVSDTRIVNPEDVSYMEDSSDSQQSATLMTCWPPGTTLQRLIVVGELTSIYK